MGKKKTRLPVSGPDTSQTFVPAAAAAATTTAISLVPPPLQPPHPQQRPATQPGSLKIHSQAPCAGTGTGVGTVVPFETFSAYQQHPLSTEQPRQYRRYHTRSSRSNGPRDPESPVSPPPAPIPSKLYLSHANEEPERLERPRKLLVLLDLNGTLLYRPRIDHTRPHRREHILRPGAQELISYLFDNHAVMVYTSAMRRNAIPCVDALLRHLTPAQRQKLIGIHPRENLGLTSAQLQAKVQVYKPLEPVWKLKTVKASAKKHGCPSWDVTNTVLLDDSAEKARANPHNLLQVPEFKLDDKVKQTAKLPEDIVRAETVIMQRVKARLEELQWEVSVARRIRVWQQQKMTLVDGTANNDKDYDDDDDSDNEDGGVSLLTPSDPNSLADSFKKVNLGQQ